MSVRASIQAVYRDLKPTQKRIADYILSLDFQKLNASIEEYARRTGASVASISRFCSRIGCGSFQNLKISLSHELSDEPPVVPPIFAPDDEPDLAIRKTFSEALANLQATERELDFQALRRLADRIRRSERLYFLGMGGSGGIGYLGELFFSHIGYSARSIADPYSMLVCAGHARPAHTFLGLSHSGRTREVLEALRAAKRNGAFIAGITNYPRSPLAELADIALVTACREHEVHFARSNSMVAQLTLLRALYILVASRSGPATARQVQGIEESVQRILRLRGRKSPAAKP